jgi:uncharacterized protein (TIGR03085 family)
MTRLAQTERSALCDTALSVGADQPTLCGEWTVKDLLVHLVLRESSPAAVGIAVPALAGAAERASARIGRRPFADLVDQVRQGPPLLSPYALPPLDRLLNTLEYFVHHEDIRRAQPGWTPRNLGDDAERMVWSMLRTAGKPLTRRSPVGVRIANVVTGSTAVLHRDAESVTVRGLPSEVALFVFGRTAQARVEVLGDPAVVARLDGDALGI